MRLVLIIDGEEWISPVFSVDGPAIELPWRVGPNVMLRRKRFVSNVSVRARVEGVGSGMRFRFRNPFNQDSDGSKYFTHIAFGGTFRNDDNEEEVQLFDGAIGVYNFTLEIRDDDKYRVCLRVPFEIETPVGCSEMVNRMIDEILDFDRLPFQVLSQQHNNILGRVKMFYSRNGNSGGSPILWSRHEALMRVVKRLKPLLQGLCRDSAVSVGDCQRLMRVDRVHRFDREILHQVRQKGIVSLYDRQLLTLKVKANCRMPVSDTKAHRVIRTFLVFCRAECRNLIKSLEVELLDPKCKNVRKSQLDKRLSMLQSIVGPFLDMQLRTGFVWSSSVDKVDLSNIDPQWFDVSNTYRKIYSVIAEYLFAAKSRASLLGKGANVDYRRADNGDPSMLQRKYDEIYEVWCYLRLVKAFADSGFEEIEHRYMETIVSDTASLNPYLPRQVVNRPLFARSGDLQLELYYQVRAHAKDKDVIPEKGRTLFYVVSHDKKRQQSTPDYLLIFHNQRSGCRYAVVMDAKAKKSVEGDVDTRRDYLEEFNIAKYSPAGKRVERPRQSWLFYWGTPTDLISVHDAIEYAPETGPGLGTNDGENFPFTADEVENCDVENTHQGHIRVNPNSSPFVRLANGRARYDRMTRNDPFVSWVQAQIGFAKKYLAIKR